eukprot:COSAG01_NODE_4234_length_5218_cov_69.637429_7_plen_74_part_00
MGRADAGRSLRVDAMEGRARFSVALVRANYSAYGEGNTADTADVLTTTQGWTEKCLCCAPLTNMPRSTDKSKK